ncbi:unnamed protein product, partial [Meganyctiphanes norvegica]
MIRSERTPISKRPRVPPKPKTSERVLEKDPVEVFCRIRPPETADEELCVTRMDIRTVKLSPPETSVAYRNNTGKEQTYKFQHVFDQDVQQKDIFDRVAKPLVSDVLNGKNGLLFAYGVTGSGKTFTMQGSPKDGGIVRRTLDVVFNSILEFQTKRYIFKTDCMNGFDAQTDADAAMDRRRNALGPKTPGKTPRVRRDISGNSSESTERIPDSSRIPNIDEDNVYGVFVAYIEIYNNYIYDLLEDTTENGMKRAPQTKVLREDTDHNMYVHGCTEVEVKSPEEALDVLHAGQKRRRIAHTRLNCESSRSHSIFSIRVVQGPLDAQGEEVVTDKNSIIISQLSLVDLAGSERTNRTKATGDRLKEAGNINNSLMTLRSCIEVLRENQVNNTNKKVPYRDSKITHYFKNFFDGEGKVKMIVCVNPKSDDYDETLPVMKFAELASEVQIQRATGPTSSQRDVGLPPGRRRANQLFKEARKRLEEEGQNVKAIEVDIAPIYTLHPDWPICKVSEETFEEIIDKLKIYLQKRIQSREKLQSDVREKVLTVRSQVEQMEKENLLIRQENSSLRSLYDDAMRKVRYLENSLVNAEASNESMQRKFEDYNNIINDCNNAKEELDTAKSRGEMEKQRMKAKLKMKLEAERDRLVHDMNSKLKEQEHALKKQMYKESVKTLQNMFGSDGRVHHSASDTDISGSHTHRTNNENMTPGPYRHRRSKSTGTTIEHRVGEILKIKLPLVKKNLQKSKGVALRQCTNEVVEKSKYLSDFSGCCQKKNTLGKVKQQLKVLVGDVLKTRGGGAQVVLQDMEVVKTRDLLDPRGNKRPSGGTPVVDRNILQERCSEGVSSSATQRHGTTPSHIKRARF